MTSTQPNDILEDLESAVGLLVDGALSGIRKSPQCPDGDRPVLYVAFAVLCALHERCTKDQILRILEEQIRD